MSARLLFFAGKGGVGKTTCAAARAVTAAAAAGPAERVLVVSTDPAHSLGDALGVRLTARPRDVWQRVGRLRAVELDAPRAFSRWLADHRRELSALLERGTWLDREDVDALLGLSIPGVDELIGLIEIARLAGSGDYSLIIVDTAPTGHLLRLLTAPRTVAAVAAALDALQREHRLIRRQFARADTRDAADRLIALLAEQAQDAASLLRDPRRTQLSWVLLPEELSVAESEDGMAAVARARICVADVIVNRVTPEGPPCPICDRRRTDERLLIDSLRTRLHTDRPVRIVPAEPREPRGPALLARIGRRLTAAPAPASRAVPRRTASRLSRASQATRAMRAMRAVRAMRLSAPAQGRFSPPESIEPLRRARVLLFGGKGGVGKTTCAAATALALARATGRRLLLLSTDPAHSLGDVLGTRIGDRVRSLPGAASNLRVRELDAAGALANRRARLEAALDEIGQAVGAVGGSSPGGAGIGELIDLAPPGVDELLGVLSVVEAQREYDTIIVDTAPTGHTLRLLEMPEAAREWLQVLMRVLLKYRSVVRPGQLAAELLDLSKSVRRLQDLLQRGDETRFIVVTRPAVVPRLETERLIERLNGLKLAVPAVVCNALTLAPGRCPRCRATQTAERIEVQTLHRALRRHLRDGRRRGTRECAIILTPLAAPPPRGIAALDRWARSWSSWSHTDPVPTSTASSRAAGRRR